MPIDIFFNSSKLRLSNTMLKKTYKKLITSIIKYLFFTLTFNPIKKKIYLMRFLGLYNSIIGKKSWYRPKIK